MRYKDNKKLNNIYEATIELVADTGLTETSVSKIAKKANISSSTIYVYFKSKDDLLIKLYIELKQKIMQVTYAGITEEAPFKKAYQKSLANFTNYMAENQKIFSFVQQFGDSPLEKTIPKDDLNVIFKAHYDFFEKGKQNGLLKKVDSNLLIIFTYYPVMEFLKEYFAGSIELNEKNLKTLLNMSWDAVKI